MEKIEFLIIRNLLYNEDYLRKVLPFLKTEYFEDQNQRVVFEEILEFVSEYNNPPTKEVLSIETQKRTDVNEDQFNKIIHLIDCLENISSEQNWLIDTTEKWCRERAIYLALMEAIQLADGKGDKSKDSIPSILQDALAVSFDNHIGHDYFQDYEERYDFYTRKEEKLEFDIEYLNKITKGGIIKKTMTILMSPTGVGKSLALCHIAASTLLQGKNVLYITLEMSEEKIAERIDANLLNVDIKDFASLPKTIFDTKINSLSKKTQGTLIIKEYPTASAHSGHFNSLLNELYLKKSFKPDLLVIDYMNICSSSRYKGNMSVNSYSYVKSIAEELRGLAVEHNVPLITATQVNRCLGLDTLLIKRGGETIQIQDIKIGDEIESHSGYVKVEHVFPVEEQDVYEITTKSGKKILCSNKHIFPTSSGEKNILSGLSVGDKLFTKNN
jgi:replicative DNA helicase